MSQTGFRRPDDSTCDLLGGWQFGEVPPLDDDSDPFSTASPPIGPKTGPATPPAPPPQNQPRNREERQSEPPRPRSTPPPDSDPFRDFRLDPGSEGLSLSIQSLLRPNLRPQAPPSHDPSHTAPPPTPPTAPIAPVRVSATVPGPRTSTTPRVGDILGGYRLVGELGRGAFARVFLAEQANLANRRVALKVSQAEGDEPLLLARLQHTHIVPIHSVEDDPLTGLRLLCMPYLGGANLAQVLEAAGGRTAPAAHRRSLVDALDEVSLRMHARPGRNVSASGYSGNPRPPLASRSAPALSAGSARSLPRRPELAESGIGSARPSGSNPYGSSARGSIARLQALWARLRWRTASTPEAPSLDERDFDQPARQFLRQANSVQAAVWIIARLAEGLEHAHSRGLLHRDLKPSNILIAADGTPMLLDFNLSTLSGPCDPDEGEKAMLGGTLPYMAPEHLDAFHPEIKGPVEAVNERSDIYALGLILFEMIAGEHPFPEPPPGTPLLEVIRKLSEARRTVPSLRRANPDVPWSLDAIARKCLDPDPARRYSRARELAEDLVLFLEDQPLKYTTEPSLRERVAKWARRHPRVCHVVPVASAAAVMMAILVGIVSLLVDHTLTLNAHGRLRHFESQFAESQFLLNLGTGPTGHIERGYDLARQTINALGLNPNGTLGSTSWANRLIEGERQAVRQEAAELILLLARARVRLADRTRSETDRREALEAAVAWLDRAERLDPHPTAALFSDRARYLGALGRADQARADRDRAAASVPSTARDFALLGTARLSQGDAVGAETELLKAIDRDPKSFWAWFALGHSRFEQGRYLDAAGDFNACVALEPSFAWPHINRGLALARAGRFEEARRSYERALRLNNRFAEAWVNLALVDLELNDLSGAENALDRAVALGRKEATVYLALAEVKARRGDREAASRLFDRLIAERPNEAAIYTARGLFRVSQDPRGAESDLTRALEYDSAQARAHYGLALLYRKTDLPRALKHAEAALATDPNLVDALQARALLRARLGLPGTVDDVDALVRTPSPYVLYNTACALAIYSQVTHQPRFSERALELLGRSIRAGFPVSRAQADPDLEPLRTLPGFAQALGTGTPDPRAL